MSSTHWMTNKIDLCKITMVHNVVNFSSIIFDTRVVKAKVPKISARWACIKRNVIFWVNVSPRVTQPYIVACFYKRRMLKWSTYDLLKIHDSYKLLEIFSINCHEVIWLAAAIIINWSSFRNQSIAHYCTKPAILFSRKWIHNFPYTFIVKTAYLTNRTVLNNMVRKSRTVLINTVRFV